MRDSDLLYKRIHKLQLQIYSLEGDELVISHKINDCYDEIDTLKVRLERVLEYEASL